MTTLYVQFSDSTQTTIITYLTGPQDPDVWPNMGTVDTSDARWRTFYDSLPAINSEFLPVPTDSTESASSSTTSTTSSTTS